MRGLFGLTAAALLGVVVSGCERAPTKSSDIAAPQFDVTAAEGRYIVVLRDNADPTALAASVSVKPIFTYVSALRGFSAVLSDPARTALERNPLVRWVEPVRIHQIAVQGVQAPPACKPKKNCPPPPPPPPPAPTCSPNYGTGPDGIWDDLGELWGMQKVRVTESPLWLDEPVDVDVAILDTGADLDHTDLCIFKSVSFDPFEATPEDANGHGTHTSGTTAARDNDNGANAKVVGVAPEARIWVVKVCNFFGICFGDAIVAGIDYVTANAAQIDVANMSLGGGGSDQDHPVDPIDCAGITGDAEHLAICNSVKAGVTYVVAAGNSAADASTFVPAAYDEVITMAAMNSSEQAAGFSNFGADVDLIAPGVDVKSDWLNNGTATASGTSMASPHGAGAAALYIAQQLGLGNPRPTAAQVRAALIANGQAWAGQGGIHPEKLLNVSGF